jgi:hypothetical protein
MTTTTLPPINYGDCLTALDINARMKELTRAYDHPTTKTAEYWAISSGLSEAFERIGSTAPVTGQESKRVRSDIGYGTVRPTEHPDGSQTIVCVGPCGAELPVNKFPTTSKGGRLNICRACQKADRDDRKQKA